MMFESPFTSYAYSYPHKSAYRPLTPDRSLQAVWRDQDTSVLFLYVHIPFCEFRCGFCNLFTLAQPQPEWPKRYLESLQRQAEAVRGCVPDATFARLAIGGGTPTFLEHAELEQLLAIVSGTMQVDGNEIPAGIEASPGTVDSSKLRLLRDFGFDRLSLGIQSFESAELKSLGRPQRDGEVQRAIELVRKVGFPTLNLDLIYGAESQTRDSWMRSVRRAAELEPEEIYLYPLYVRRLTGLGRISRLGLEPEARRQWDDQRIDLYRAARDYLLDRGYRQASMRMFASPRATQSDSPDYCCQSDGMIGLGCGARSYTDSLHYSYDYAVEAHEVRRILDDYMRRDAESFSRAEYGYELDREDQQRRFLILSLLQSNGLRRSGYAERFGSDVMDDFPSLAELSLRDMLLVEPDRLQLTAKGLQWSDWIGPWLNSARVRELIEPLDVV